jgi:tetratricopeptide (TPR) repeat protein
LIKRLTNPLLLLAVLVFAACATSTPTPLATPTGDDRYLVDPRVGFNQLVDERTEGRFNQAWAHYLAGQTEDARKRFTEILTRNPDYLPALLGTAAVELRQGRRTQALEIVKRVQDRRPDYLAARVYEAEIAIADGDERAALELYRQVALAPNAPATAAERVRYLERTLFEELVTSARSAPDAAAIPLLRDALTLNAGAAEARLLLSQKLITERDFEEARRVIDPIVNSADADRPEVQELLAEIDAGLGRYQEAIVRYDRLARRTREDRHAQRLEQIKEQWRLQNMPPQYQAAVESPAINRGDFAVLLYWQVAPVRFAQGLSSPPIAIDLADVPGREEIIRAIAVGLYDVDPVTRRVYPSRTITAASLSRLATRLLTSRGATCARGLSSEQVLQACGVSDPMLTLPADEPIPGRTAVAVLDQIQAALTR